VGGVLEESAQIALSWIRAHAFELGLEQLQPAAAHAAEEPAAAWRSLVPGRAPRPPRPALHDSPELLCSGGAGVQLAAALAPAPAPAAAPSPALCWDLHVHLPSGAVQKDGPSAGITLAAALVSLLSGRCLRGDTAMTGELTLRGHVLPVGGVREKVLAARAAGLARVLVPARNLREVELEVPEAERRGLEVVGVERLEQVLLHAFDPPYVLLPRPRL
jgi:hypothetical protein